MDPNATLDDLLAAFVDGAREDAVDALRRLLEWCDDKGGFLPNVRREPGKRAGEVSVYYVG